jgi:hypothetical protein
MAAISTIGIISVATYGNRSSIIGKGHGSPEAVTRRFSIQVGPAHGAPAILESKDSHMTTVHPRIVIFEPSNGQHSSLPSLVSAKL